jgi:outer membrane protein assembly factor BamB
VNIYVIGGKEKNGLNEEWHQYEKGIILKVNSNTGKIHPCKEYISPTEVCPPNNPSILFKAGTIFNKNLYVCTQTEVLIYSLPDFALECFISLPCFNDLHHVRPTKNGTFLIANTGLDMVVEISLQGKVVREWDVLNEKSWNKFQKQVDYRKIHSTKPHKSHPNYVFQIGDDIWVTRCLQKDALCLTQPDQKMMIGNAMIHDGIVYNESIYFTQVDGHLIVFNSNNYKMKQVIDLNKISRGNKPLGWCRGIKVIDDSQIIVGFSRLRPTRVVEENGNVKMHGNFGTMPTRIACYNIQTNELIWQYNVENNGLNAIYSIHTENEFL